MSFLLFGYTVPCALSTMRSCHFAEYERITLNAMEQRVLPPDVRIKIAVAQANAGEDREEKMEADVRRRCFVEGGGVARKKKSK